MSNLSRDEKRFENIGFSWKQPEFKFMEEDNVRRKQRNEKILAKIQELKLSSSLQFSRSEALRQIQIEYNSLVEKCSRQTSALLTTPLCYYSQKTLPSSVQNATKENVSVGVNTEITGSVIQEELNETQRLKESFQSAQFTVFGEKNERNMTLRNSIGKINEIEEIHVVDNVSTSDSENIFSHLIRETNAQRAAVTLETINKLLADTPTFECLKNSSLSPSVQQLDFSTQNKNNGGETNFSLHFPRDITENDVKDELKSENSSFSSHKIMSERIGRKNRFELERHEAAESESKNMKNESNSETESESEEEELTSEGTNQSSQKNNSHADSNNKFTNEIKATDDKSYSFDENYDPSPRNDIKSLSEELKSELEEAKNSRGFSKEEENKNGEEIKKIENKAGEGEKTRKQEPGVIHKGKVKLGYDDSEEESEVSQKLGGRENSWEIKNSALLENKAEDEDDEFFNF